MTILIFNAGAQGNQESRVKKYGIKDGLSQAVVNSISQDNQGLMWFATEDGLNRFDGYSFKNYKNDPDNPKTLADNFIQNIFRDSEGSFWVSSRKGLHHFDESREQFTLYQHAVTGQEVTSPQNDVSFITEGRAGNLWVAWYGAGFASFDKKTKIFTPYNPRNLKGLSSTQTIVLHEDKFGWLWVGTQNGGLNVYRVTNGKVVERNELLSNTDAIPSSNIRCFAEDASGNIWIGTSSGLVVYKRQANQFHTFDFKTLAGQHGNIFSLLIDHQENLWVGMQGVGLFLLDLRQFVDRPLEQAAFRHIEVLRDYDISRCTVQSLYEDKDGNLWLGTFGEGIYMKSSAEERFTKIQTRQFFKTASNVVQYHAVTYDENGFLWLGTEGNGIYKSKLNGEVVHHYTADGRATSLTDNSVQCALRDRSNNLWFGTYSKGIFRYDAHHDSFVNYTYKGQHTGSGANDVRALFEDAGGNIWVGTNRGGLCQIDKNAQTYGNPPGINSILMDGDIRAIEEGRHGKFWIGLYGDALYEFDARSKKASQLFYATEKTSGLTSNVVFALRNDHHDKLWIGTGGGGLYAYDYKTKALTHYDEKAGLGNNTVYAILVDNSNSLWMGTNKGLTKYEQDKQRFTNFDANDGLQEGQFNVGAAAYNDIAGYMCFGGTMGVNVFYPERVMRDLKEPEVLISAFELFNKPIEVNEKNDSEFVLDQVISQTQHITLSHDQSVFTFEFVGLNYSYPEKNQYAYMLEGLDDDWNYVGHQRSATYRYLPAGDYTFKVKASNEDNTWGDHYASIDITVLPPFYRTWWAYSFYFAMSLAIGGTVFMIRRKQDRLKKRLKIEKAQRKRERQRVREKLSFFTEVSHEFRTPLTLIIGPLEEMVNQESNPSTVRKLKLVNRNAHKLLSLINKLLEYRKIESGHVTLKVSEENIVAFLEEIHITFKDLAVQKNIDFVLNTPEPSARVWFDTERMEMAVTNILSNAFKYIGQGNQISITLLENADKMVVQIKDNGLGIPEKHLYNIFHWFYKGTDAGPMSSGIGLALARKILHLHHGEITVESKEGQGSTFNIELLKGNTHFKPEEIVLEKDRQKLVAESLQLPAWHAPAQADEDGAAHKGVPGVLIVEDDEDIRSFLKEYFEKRYRILEAADGKEALAMALEFHPDLIISDVMMPEMDGITLTRHLKTNLRTSHIPIILLTARNTHSQHKEGIEGGADAYITKPFSPEMLSVTIQNLLQLRENLKRFYRNLFTQHTDPPPNVQTGLEEKFLHTIHDTLKANMDNPGFNVNELCDSLNMSRTLVYKKVKMLTGLTPVEYLRSLRMQEAARLLKTNQYKVFEVVYMVGFSDLKYFRQCFMKEFGHPPSEYGKSTSPSA
jgi:ligand-binding sensor domain-containing protein/signal transduction histidine kinase/CheY-like chemotaxis protein